MIRRTEGFTHCQMLFEHAGGGGDARLGQRYDRGMRYPFLAIALAALCAAASAKAEEFSHGFPKSPDFFPIAVWLQAPANAPRYKAIGINTYVGLWRGPNQEQLSALENAGMLLVCSQNRFALDNKESKTIVAWMHGDEPDNAQEKPDRKGYGPPILPEKIVADYKRIKENDPTRPVMLNLGQGVAWDNYIGRGTRRNHAEDYPEYVKGCDIASFDIYPAVHEDKAITGKLEYVGNGTARLRDWAGPAKKVWACIGCTRISNPNAKPTPEQVKAEVWLAITNGASGLIYFSHVFKPSFIEAGLLADAEMAAAVGEINKEVMSVAPALNSPTVADLAKCDNANISVLQKRVGNAVFLLTVSKSNAPEKANFTLLSSKGADQAEVLDEGRKISLVAGGFGDAYKPYEVHLYKVVEKQP
jgi:hypothetical protein